MTAVIGGMREPRQYRAAPPLTAALDQFRLMPNGISGTPPEVYFAMGKPYETTAFDLAQGKRLYSWFGCSACHGEGTGGKGPSFIDGWWHYGPSMVSIVASIRDGRPHGMPAFKDKMTSDQIWQLSGYIKSLGAYTASVNATSRSDEKTSRPAENRAPAALLFNEGPQPLHPDQGPRP
ncbi:MAG TPA: c-type cytochrome [Pseudorhizobium sp.]|nr:c-type cytochrome [Pseudorhizobium sp.]